MHPININGFAGSNLALDPRLLPVAVGTFVVDAEPGFGDLRPLHDRLTVATVPTIAQRITIYRLGRDVPSDTLYWLSWATRVNVIRGFDAEDATERVYFTGNGTPKWTDNVIGLAGGAPYPQGVRELSMPAPTTPVIATLTTNGTGTDGTRFYVHTFVNELGWESAPSPVSVGLNCKTGAIVALSSLPAAPAGNYGIVARRIYATSPGTSGTSAFLFLREIAIGSTATTDDARTLGDALATVGWLPLDAAAFGLLALWNGMAAAIVGKRIVFCQPDAIYAWLVKYDFPVNDRPVALAKWEQNLLVLTTGAPVLLQGQEPGSMSETPAMMSAPCRAARGVVEFKHGVCWPSSEGLAYTGSADLLTLGLMTPRQWKALHPETIVAGRWGRFYVASFNDGVSRRGFMFDPKAPARGIWWLSTGFDACWYDELADALFVLEGGNVRKFDGADALLTAKFTSKKFRQVGPRNFAWCKVASNAYPVTVKVYCDDVLRFTKVVPNENPFTLPGGFTAEDWQVEVQASLGTTQAVRLATDLNDFKNA